MQSLECSLPVRLSIPFSCLYNRLLAYVYGALFAPFFCTVRCSCTSCVLLFSLFLSRKRPVICPVLSRHILVLWPLPLAVAHSRPAPRCAMQFARTRGRRQPPFTLRPWACTFPRPHLRHALHGACRHASARSVMCAGTRPLPSAAADPLPAHHHCQIAALAAAVAAAVKLRKKNPQPFCILPPPAGQMHNTAAAFLVPSSRSDF